MMIRFEPLDPPLLMIEYVNEEEDYNVVTIAVGDPVLYRAVATINVSRSCVTVCPRLRRLIRVLRRMRFSCSEDFCTKRVSSYEEANVLGTEVLKRIVEAV